MPLIVEGYRSTSVAASYYAYWGELAGSPSAPLPLTFCSPSAHLPLPFHWKPGNLETWKLGNWDTGILGNWEKWKLGNSAVFNRFQRFLAFFSRLQPFSTVLYSFNRFNWVKKIYFLIFFLPSRDSVSTICKIIIQYINLLNQKYEKQ